MAKKYQKVLATSLILLTWSTGRDRDTSSLGWVGSSSYLMLGLVFHHLCLFDLKRCYLSLLLSPRLGIDQTRWFLMNEVAFGNDGDFNEKVFFFRSQSIYVTIRYNHNPIYLFILIITI